MRNILFLSFLFPTFLFSQNGELTYGQTIDINYTKNIKNNKSIDSYITKDGLTISIGDTLIVGQALNEGEKYMFNDVFKYIAIGHVRGVNNDEFNFLPFSYSENKIIVKSIFVTHEKPEGYSLWPNRKETPLYVSIFTKNPKIEINSLKRVSQALSYSRKTIVDIEKALSTGEIVNPNAPLTKEQAISKLKESKDLMELDLISEQEYEDIKKQLTPIILGE